MAKSKAKMVTGQSMNIQQLKSLWGSEKEAFKEKELGALQNFVRKVFECIELFNLEEGKESIAPQIRKNVFIQEDTDNIARNRFISLQYSVHDLGYYLSNPCIGRHSSISLTSRVL